jgi:hypothetical protein
MFTTNNVRSYLDLIANSILTSNESSIQSSTADKQLNMERVKTVYRSV